jgi:hypothetical protein
MISVQLFKTAAACSDNGQLIESVAHREPWDSGAAQTLDVKILLSPRASCVTM